MKDENKCNVIFKRIIKKEFTVHPISCDMTDYQNYKLQVDKLFNDPKYYFSNSLNGKEKVIIGKKISNIKFHNRIPLIPTKSPRKTFSSKKSNKNSPKRISSKIISPKKTNYSFFSNHSNLQPNQKYVDNITLNQIYDNFRKKQPILVKKKNFSLLNSITKSDFEQKIETQERTLKKFYNQTKSRNKMIKRILDLTNKDEKHLLINTSDNYRIKKEFITEIEEEVEKNKQKPLYSWQTSLRYSNDFKDNYYINVGIRNPNWQLFINKDIKGNKECIRNPSFDFCINNNDNNNVFKKILNSGYVIKTIPSKNIPIKNLYKLCIKGEKLLSFESNNSKLLKGRKILHFNENEPIEKKEYLITHLNNE